MLFERIPRGTYFRKDAWEGMTVGIAQRVFQENKKQSRKGRLGNDRGAIHVTKTQPQSKKQYGED